MMLLFILYLSQGQINENNHAIQRLLVNTQVNCNYDVSLKIVPQMNQCYTEKCPDDYSSSVAITLRNSSMVVVCFNNSQWECDKQCYGCYHTGKSDCVQCNDIKNRGSGNMVDFQTILNLNKLPCNCNPGFVEDEPKSTNCRCPNGKFIEEMLPDMNVCTPCSPGCKFCSDKKSCQQCAAGIGRSQDTSKLCVCVTGYIEFVPSVDDCKVACQEPCKVCVDGSTVLCQTCIDSSMTINDQKMCICPLRYYYSKTTNYYCQPCHYSCLTCSGPAKSNCLSCSVESLRRFSVNNCDCPQYYSDVNGQEICIICDWTCLTCSTTTTCDSCPVDSNRIKSTLCYCMDKYTNDLNSVNCVCNDFEQIIQACLYSCETCDQTYDQCLTCPDNSFRQLINSQCLCPARYYDDQIAQCQPCDFSCLTCIDGQPSGCITCDTSKNRQIQNGYCNCISGYGYIDDQTELCQICSQYCVTCSQIDTCLTCNLLNKRVLSDDSKCVCDNFYTEINSNCQKCHYTCHTCQDLSKEGCITCNQDNGWVMKANNQCGCSDGQFDYNQVCKQCYYQCLTCLNRYSDGCITCSSSRIRSDSNKVTSSCLCSTQQFIDDGINMECQPCHYSCYTCSGGADNNCLSCYDNSQIQTTVNRQFLFGSCLCPEKWLDDQTNEKCVACHPSCLKCFDTTEYGCLICSPQEFRIQQSNSCFCLDGYFEDSQFICQPCNYRCLTCQLDATNCLTCLSGSNRYLDFQDQNLLYQTCKCPALFPNDVQGNPICQRNYQFQKQKKIACHFSCQNCLKQEINTCTLCDDNSQRYLSQENYCLCKLSYYEIGSAECAPCSSYCLGCASNPDNCISCNQDDFRELNNNQCVCGVRFGLQLLSYYENNPRDPTCLVCHYSCQTCNGPNYDNCLTCSDLDFRQQTTTYCLCKDSYIDLNERLCQRCDYQCQTCQMAKSLCTSCPPNSLRTLNPLSQSCDCPFGYYDNQQSVCETCDINCETCTNTSITCLSCKSNTNRIYNNLGYSCDCYQGFYDNLDGTCQKCHFSCISCIGPLSTDCIICPEFTVTQRQKNLNQCQCSDGNFDDGVNQICPQCSVTCLTCQNNKNYCLDCIDSQNRHLQQNQCTCKDQYFDSGNSVCDQCNVKCQKCQLNANYCIQCDQLLKRQLNSINNFCDCEIGYFDDGNLLCKQCNIKCQKCINSSDNCIACDTNSYRELTQSNCQCIQGTLDTGLQQCLLCDKNCLTCINTISNCSSCDGNLNRMLYQNRCQCQYGYYENSYLICQICDELCLECNSKSICTKCDQQQNRTLNYLGQCVCLNGYFENQSKTCQKCSLICLNCETNQNNCISCNSNRYLSNNLCLCLDGLYDDGNNNCLYCDFKCQTCSQSSTNCLSCSPNSNRTFKNNTCDCAGGYYDQGSQNCIKCDQSCLTCSLNINTCTSCDISHNRQLNGQQCNCFVGYFDSNKVCELCHYSCKTCQISSIQCTSCEISKTFRLDQRFGFNQCPCLPGFYDNGQLICQKCSYQCLNCRSSSDNCTACNNNLGYFRINQIPKCECQAGYYDDGIQIVCQKCSNNCLTCLFNQSNCTFCESARKRRSTPQCDCRDSYYVDKNQFCQSCKANCLTCIQNESNCLSCQPDRIGKLCLCQQGYYEIYAQTCQTCNYKCATCADDQLNCLSCKGDRTNPPNCICQDHYYDDFVQQNCLICNQNCGKCDLNGCIDCSANRILNIKQCDCPINSISYTDTPYCSNCDVAVVKGYFSDDLTTIQYQFEYQLQYNFDIMVTEEEYCSQLILKGTLIKLGQKPLCYIDHKNLNILLGDGAQMNIGDSVNFNSTQLKHDNCPQPLQLIIRTNINSPSNLLKPQVQLQYPLSQISPCQIIQILIIQQQINAGRNLQLRWEVQQLNQDSNIMDIINQANILQMQTLSFPQSTLPELSNITFILTITNILQQSNQIQFNITTLSSSTPSFNFITTKTKYYSWVPIQIQINYDNSICQNKKIVQWSNPIKITFSEIQTQRSPQNSKQLNFEQSVIQSQYSKDQITATIPAKSLSINSNYTIQGQFLDLINGNTITQVFNIQIGKSPLIAKIDGGTRIQSYMFQFELLTLARDPDENFDWNQDPDITYQIKCINMQKQGQSCQDLYGKSIRFNQTYFQQLKANIFQPYSVIQFIATCFKGSQSTSTQSIIIFLDQDIPRLNVSYPIGYLQRDININERLYFQIELNNIDNSLVDYSYGLIYNYQTVYVSQNPNKYIQFSIWDAFIAFDQITQLTIRIQAHKLIDFMPQMFMIKLNINLPPINTEINIQPQYGNAYFTIFNISALNSKDKDMPLQYRFAYYQSNELMEQDKKTDHINNLIILQDFQNTQQYSGLLESGNLQFIISIKDYYGSIVNYTQDVKVLSFYEQINKIQNDSLDCSDFLTHLVYNNIEQWIILSQELFKLYNSNVIKNCQQSIYTVLQGLSFKLIQYQDQTSNKNVLNRIFISLQQFYSLEYLNKVRLIQESQICINENNYFVNFNKSNFENKSDNEQLQIILQSLSTQMTQTVKDSTIYYNSIYDSLNSGDDSIQGNFQYNINQRKNLILLLGNVYGLAFPSRMNISLLLNQLIISFQNQLQLDSLPLRLISRYIGVQIMRLGQTKFLKYIILDPLYEDQINFNLEIFVSIIRYSSNIFIYTSNFSQQFINMTYIYSSDEQQDNQTKTIRLVEIISLIDTPMFIPYIATQVDKKYIQMNKLNGFFIAFNTEYYINKCKQDNIISQFVCVSYINDLWQIGYCQINYIAINSTVNEIQCICSYLSPITIMIMSNQTITIPIEQKPKQFLVYQATIEFMYNKLLFIIMISILLLLLLFINISKLILTPKEINQLNNDSQDTKLDMLTQAPRMSFKKYKENLIYLHQFTKIYMLENRQLNKIQKIILCYLNFIFLATLIYLFDFVISIKIMTFIVSILSQLLLQAITKIFEGFFTGPKILSIIGYILTVSIILGQFLLMAFIQGNKSSQWELTIMFIVGLIVVNTIIEPIIQYLRLHFMHQIYPVLKENQMDPQIHFIYYFLQDEFILHLIQQREQS